MKQTIILMLMLLLLLTACAVPTVSAPLETTQPATEPITEPTPEPTTEPAAVPETIPVRILPLSLDPEIREFYSIAEADGSRIADPNGQMYVFPRNPAIWSQRGSVHGSSYLQPSGSITYDPGNVVDGSRSTVWAEGAEGYGIGESIDIAWFHNEPGTDQRFIYRTLCIVNGYAQNEQKWRANSRVKSLELYVNGRYLVNLQLRDTIKPQYFDLREAEISAAAGETTQFRFRIAEVYPGEQYEDTCITGIEFELTPAKEAAVVQTVSLMPKVREFFYMSGEMEVEEYDPSGEHYGYPRDYTDRCSVWCAVTGVETFVEVSSFLPPAGQYSYLPGNVVDGSRDTVWAEGADGCGIGEYIEIVRSYNEPGEPQQFDYRSVCIVNGYAQNEQKWRANGRVKTLEFYVNGMHLANLQLNDTIKPQYFDLTGLKISAAAGESTRFCFRIAEVYPGETYEDTCITGIEFEFWTPNH